MNDSSGRKDHSGDRTPDRQAARARRRSARRDARRDALGRQIDTSIASPCISVCQIDNATGECLGCFRTIDEIRDWIIMTAEEKTRVLGELEQRKAGAATNAGDP